MEQTKDYRELIVWRRSIELIKEVYRLIKLLPKEETFALADQMRRSSVSIASNIAEGTARSGEKDFLHFLSISLGSEYELQTQLFICTELGYFSEEQSALAISLCNEVGKMLNTMMKKLRSNRLQLTTSN